MLLNDFFWTKWKLYNRTNNETMDNDILELCSKTFNHGVSI